MLAARGSVPCAAAVRHASSRGRDNSASSCAMLSHRSSTSWSRSARASLKSGANSVFTASEVAVFTTRFNWRRVAAVGQWRLCEAEARVCRGMVSRIKFQDGVRRSQSDWLTLGTRKLAWADFITPFAPSFTADSFPLHDIENPIAFHCMKPSQPDDLCSDFRRRASPNVRRNEPFHIFAITMVSPILRVKFSSTETTSRFW